MLNLAFRFLLASRSSVADYGAFALASSSITYCAVFGAFNLGQAAARYIPVVRDAARRPLLLALVGLNALSSLIAGLAAGVLLLHLGFSNSIVLIAAVGAFLYSVTGLLEGILRGFDLTAFQATNQVIVSGGRLLLALLAIMAFPARLTAFHGTCLFVGGLGLGFAFPVVSLRLRREFERTGDLDRPPLRVIFRFAFLLTGANLATSAVGFVNRLLLSHYCSLDEVAHYDNGLVAYGAFQTLLSSFVLVSLPHYARTEQNGTMRVPAVRRVLPPFLVLYAVLFLPEMTGTTTTILGLFKVASYAPFYPIFLVLLLGLPAEFLFVSVSSPLQARSRAGAVLASSTGAAILGIVSGLILIPRFGMAGAALSSLINAVGLAIAGYAARVVTRLPIEAA